MIFKFQTIHYRHLTSAQHRIFFLFLSLGLESFFFLSYEFD